MPYCMPPTYLLHTHSLRQAVERGRATGEVARLRGGVDGGLTLPQLASAAQGPLYPPSHIHMHTLPQLASAPQGPL